MLTVLLALLLLMLGLLSNGLVCPNRSIETPNPRLDNAFKFCNAGKLNIEGGVVNRSLLS